MVIIKKLKKFRDTLRRNKSVLYCVRCGSTNVSQESPSRLCCHDCGNTLEWDGLSFGVVQVSRRPKAMAEQANKAFELRERTPPWVDVAGAQEHTEKAHE